MICKRLIPAFLIVVTALSAYAHEFVGDIQTLEKLRDDARAARQALSDGDVIVTTIPERSSPEPSFAAKAKSDFFPASF